jgi:uncharacterized protein YndB with AHSA1/START domain
MSVPDKIERVLILPVSPERAWRAIAEPEEMSHWFGSAVEIEPGMTPGAVGLFRWSNDAFRFIVRVVDPPRRFAYEWYPGSGEDLNLPFDQLPKTLVEFALEPAEGGTRLTVTETGFAALASDHYARAWRENNEGWDEELAELAAYCATLA